MISLCMKQTSLGTMYYHVYLFSNLQVFFMNNLGVVESYLTLDLEVQGSNPAVSILFGHFCQFGDIQM